MPASFLETLKVHVVFFVTIFGQITCPSVFSIGTWHCIACMQGTVDMELIEVVSDGSCDLPKNRSTMSDYGNSVNLGQYNNNLFV